MAKEFKGRKNALALDIVFADTGLSTDDILKSHGVSRGEYAKWLCDGAYLEYLVALTDSAAMAESARILKSLAGMSASGDAKAAKTFFDLLSKRLESASLADESDTLSSVKLDLFGDDAPL